MDPRRDDLCDVRVRDMGGGGSSGDSGGGGGDDGGGGMAVSVGGGWCIGPADGSAFSFRAFWSLSWWSVWARRRLRKGQIGMTITRRSAEQPSSSHAGQLVFAFFGECSV